MLRAPRASGDRLVGDVLVPLGAARGVRGAVNVNAWLVERGLALPAFYDSMMDEEIAALRALAIAARTRRRGLWPASPRASPHSSGTAPTAAAAPASTSAPTAASWSSRRPTAARPPGP